MTKILLFIFLCVIPATSFALPISDIDTQYVSKYLRSGIYGWRSSYDISFENQDLLIDIDILLVGDDPGSVLLNTWEQGIESIWGNAFDIFDGTYLYDTVFNVDWGSVGTTADHRVNVHSGTGRTNMLNWYTDRPGGWSNSWHDEIAAHEFGHMFGLYDEYVGGATNPSTGLIRPDSIMGQRLASPCADHYDPFRMWLQDNSGLDLVMVSNSGDHYYSPAPVPEPATYLLFGSGLFGILAFRRSSRSGRKVGLV